LLAFATTKILKRNIPWKNFKSLSTTEIISKIKLSVREKIFIVIREIREIFIEEVVISTKPEIRLNLTLEENRIYTGNIYLFV